MKTRLLALACGLILVAGCSPDPAPTATTAPPAEQPAATSPAAPTESAEPSAAPADTLTLNVADLPKLDGSTANIPLCSLLVQRLTGVVEAQADSLCDFSTTPVAYQNITNEAYEGYEPPRLLLAYEPDEGTKQTVADLGVELEYHPIGRDALVFITNSSNEVAGLTTEQIKSIYTGKTTNWKDVGGADAKIVAYQRPEDSGSQSLMRKLVMGNTEMAEAPTELVTDSMSGLTEGVASYSNTGNALGYSVFYYVTDMLSMPELKLLAVDGVEPTKETIAADQYPYINEFYAVVRKDEPADSTARKIVEWLESADGAALVAEAGYVGLK
jgi:phosphate transport system substrate-binding protein